MHVSVLLLCMCALCADLIPCRQEEGVRSSDSRITVKTKCYVGERKAPCVPSSPARAGGTLKCGTVSPVFA